MTKQIPLRARDGSVRAYALVDDADFSDVSRFTWCLAPGGYARRSSPRPEAKKIPMHRHLLGLTPGDGKIVDHINRDPLDNRRMNLRLGTHGLNMQNLKVDRTNSHTSRFRGVCWNPRRNQWQATCRVNNKQHHLGWFAPHEEEKAGAVAAAFRAKHMPFSEEAAA